MMRQALVALGPKSMITGVLVGGAALALGALFLPHAAASSVSSGMYRLVLDAPEENGAFYLSAWAEGDVFVGSRDPKAITFVRRGDEHDGCAWQGTERLSRMRAGVYAYTYDETILSCKPGARPYRKTPRTGVVTVESWSGPATATALTGVQPAGETWNTAMNDVDDEDCADQDADDDAEEALADAQREIADAQREIEDAVRQANEEVRAALAETADND